LTLNNIFNPFMIWLLRSPLDMLASKNTLLITFIGLKSCISYTTPVNYMPYAKYFNVRLDPEDNPYREDIASAGKDRVMVMLRAD
jgi:hypothetical protein